MSAVAVRELDLDLDAFEGPFDLLLTLVLKQELDLADVEVAEIASLARTVDADLIVAGGVTDLAGVRRVRDAGAAGIILGEALLSGAIDYQTAREAAA